MFVQIKLSTYKNNSYDFFQTIRFLWPTLYAWKWFSKSYSLAWELGQTIRLTYEFNSMNDNIWK